MKIIKTSNYKKAQDPRGIEKALEDFGGGIAAGGKMKVEQYANEIVARVNQGEDPQSAFDNVMMSHQIGVDPRTGQKTGAMQAMRSNVAERAKQLLNQNQPSQEKQPPEQSPSESSLWALPVR